MKKAVKKATTKKTEKCTEKEFVKEPIQTGITIKCMEDKKDKPLWKIANPIGRPAKFKTADEFWNAAVEYFEWADVNPIPLSSKKSLSKTQKKGDGGSIQKVDETIPRPYTLFGLCSYLNIPQWRVFKENCSKRVNGAQKFLAVINAIENIITSNQSDGAMVGIYNANLTSRLNGFKETQDLTTNGEPLQMSKEDLVDELVKLRDVTGDLEMK